MPGRTHFVFKWEHDEPGDRLYSVIRVSTFKKPLVYQTSGIEAVIKGSTGRWHCVIFPVGSWARKSVMHYKVFETLEPARRWIRETLKSEDAAVTLAIKSALKERHKKKAA